MRRGSSILRIRFFNVDVANGHLDIHFVSVIEQVVVSAIEVKSVDYVDPPCFFSPTPTATDTFTIAPTSTPDQNCAPQSPIAYTPPSTLAVRGASGDLWADRVLGQTDQAPDGSGGEYPQFGFRGNQAQSSHQGNNL